MTTLKAALQEVCYLELEDIPSEEALSADDTLTFSATFERKMKKLIRRTDHPIRHRVAQAVACILLVVLLSGCAALAFSPEARAEFMGWVKELQQKWFSYQYAGEVDTAPKNTLYYPAWLPEGYQEIKEPQSGTFVHALYENESGSRLSFAYQVGLEDLTFRVEWDGAQIQHTSVTGAPADLFLNTEGGANVLVWTDEAKGIVFWITAQLSGEDLVRVAESIRESEPLGWIYRPTWLPPGSWIDNSVELDGEGDTLYRTSEGVPVEFCYSKSGVSPYAGRPDGQTITLKNGPATLYPAEQTGTGQILMWSDRDTGYALWLISEIAVEDMVRFAESVQIYMHDMTSVFEIDTIEEELLSSPLYGKAEKALTDEFLAWVKEYARRDAAMGIYMSDDYQKMEKAYMAEHISPERNSVIVKVSNLLENNLSTKSHVLCLIEPFCFASIHKDEYGTTALIYNENGTMIAGYTSIDAYMSGGEYANVDEYIEANGIPGIGDYITADGIWILVPTFEEMLFNYHVTQIYYKTYQENTVDKP